MGTKDITEKYLARYNDVFADIVNVLLFSGERVVAPQDLEPGENKSVYKADGKPHEQERDVSKRWVKKNITFSLFGMEHQTSVDDNMPLRIISYDGGAYREQIGKNNKKYPVISLVLHFGTEKRWSGPKNLKDCMDIDCRIADYVNDYRIHVFDIAFLTDEQVQLFQSDFRIVADYFVQIRKNKDYIPGKETIEHMDAVLKLLSVLTNDQRFEEAQEEPGKEQSMCEVLDKVENRGIEKGIRRGMEQGLEQGLEQGIKRANKLNLLLSKQGRLDDIIRSAEDMNYQMKLMKEFGL